MTSSPPDRRHCPAARHGTVAAYYRLGCRCPDAREAVRLYTKRRRQGRPETRRIDATGTRRRIRALMAIGHNAEAIGAAAGMSPFQVQQTAANRKFVSAGTSEAISRAYETLSGTPGMSAKTRARARNAGWAPPLAWEYLNIDDPATQPDGLSPSDPAEDLVVDEVAVHRAAAGDASVRLNPAEREAVMLLMFRRGRSLHAIGNVARASEKTVQKVLAKHGVRRPDRRVAA